MHFELVARTVALVGIVGGLAGCPGSLNDPAEFASGSPGSDSSTESGGGTPACAADVPTMILSPTCGVVGCHNPASPAEGLDLESPGVASRLLDVPEAEMPSLGLLLIDSMDPGSSVILTKLQANTVPYGSQMPFGGTPLSPQQVACVAAWIDSVTASADAGSADAREESASDPRGDASKRD